jgi:hypothetical protein
MSEALIAMLWQEEVRQTISKIRLALVCLEETKPSSLTPTLVRRILGPQLENNFTYLSTDGARGGILIAAMELVFSLNH